MTTEALLVEADHRPEASTPPRSSALIRSNNKSKKSKNYLEDETFGQTKIKMRRFRLTFDKYLHELDFRYHVYNKSRTIVKFCVLALIIISIIPFFLDPFYYKYSGGKLISRAIVRGVIQVPTGMFWLYYTFKKSGGQSGRGGGGSSRHNRQAIADWYRGRRCINLEYYHSGGLAALVISVCTLFQTIVSGEPDHGIYMIYFFVVYLFVGLPYFFAFVITWSTYTIFVCAMPFVVDSVSSMGRFSSQSFQLSAVYLGLTNSLLTIAAYFLEKSERNEFIHEKALEHQQNITQGLLKDLLPRHVMETLRSVSANSDWMIAENVEECTILFSDLVSFTKWASKMPPSDLIQRLHELYTCFDELVDLNRVYKVETIGDAYFVSSNCPIMVQDHAQRCLLLGKHMMEECRKLDWDGYTPKMRIGIHTGPVMAGVVGRKMPRYHLFGRTVLIAEELESSGKPDKLHISETTHRCLLECETAMKWEIHKRPETQSVLHGEMELQTYLVNLDEFLYQDEDQEGEPHTTNAVINTNTDTIATIVVENA